MTEAGSRILRGALKGAARGGPLAAIASVTTGTAVIVTIPAWVPFVGTGVAISTGTVAVWTTAGAVLGAAAQALREKRAIAREESVFREEFGL